MILIFGENENFYFDDLKGTRKWRAWPAFDRHMNSGTVGTITTMSFGEGQSFFMNYKNPANPLLDYNHWDDPADKYPKLHSWLFTEDLPHNRGGVIVALGQNGAFFASSNQGHRWRGMPEECSDYYQKFTRPDVFQRSRFSCADFGVNGSFLGIGIDNVWFWGLSKEYPELSKLLGSKGTTGITTIYINPFAANQHFVVYQNGTIHWSLPPCWIQDMQSLFQGYAVQAGAHVPQPPAYPSRPATKPSSSGKWKPSWMSGSNNSSPVPVQTQYSPPPVQPSPFANPYLAPQQAQPGFDFNQFMGLTQSALEAYNNAQGGQQAYSGGSNIISGLQIANDLTSNGLMIGQLVGQGIGVAGAAAACTVM